MTDIDSSRVHFLNITDNDDKQRIDNFIRKKYPSLPKSRIYQMLRKGEVRLNKKRVKPDSRISAGDVMRLPPIQNAQAELVDVPAFWKQRIKEAILYEDDDFIILNKPAGIAVHGGSMQGISLIDIVRSLWPHPAPELGHRIDKNTSGALVLGKHRKALIAFQNALKQGTVEKRYWGLVEGKWNPNVTEVVVKLRKENYGLQHKMHISEEGKLAKTYFYILRNFKRATLMEAVLETGRTHQIRVSAAEEGHGIAGDEVYGDEKFNQWLRAEGYKGMFLHSREIKFFYNERCIHVKAALPKAAQELLDKWS